MLLWLNDWSKIPAARFQSLAESLHKRVEAVIAAYQCLRLWNEMLYNYRTCQKPVVETTDLDQSEKKAKIFVILDTNLSQFC